MTKENKEPSISDYLKKEYSSKPQDASDIPSSSNEENHKKPAKSTFQKILAFLLSALFISLGANYVKHIRQEKTILEIVNTTNLTLPKQIDDDMTLNVLTHDENKITHHYSFKNISYDNLRSIADIDKKLAALTRTTSIEIKNKMCSSNVDRPLLDMGIILEGEFKTSDGHLLATIPVSKTDCLK